MTPRRSSVPGDRESTARADALLETCRPLPGLPPAAHARVKRRLASTLARGTSRRARWLKPVVVIPALLLCGVASGVALDRIVLTRSSRSAGETKATVAPVGRRLHGGRGGLHRAQAPAEPAPVADVPGVAREGPNASPVSPLPAAGEGKPAVVLPRTPSRRLAMSPPTIPADEARLFAPVELPRTVPPPEPVAVPEPRESPPPVLAPAPAPVLPPPPSVPPPTSAPPGLSEERLLAAAVRALRSQNDARSALGALDEYRARYPQGRLLVEASALRASALVALSRRDEALHVLDGLDLARVPGGLERQVQRGELRAAADRQREAIADFDRVLARVGHGDLAERALWGRAQSRLGVGDRAGAENDAALYLQRHPSGRFAGPAARLAGAAR
jgi:hypothetical protein